MTDPELVEKKLAFIEARVRELRDLARPELIEVDVREERFVAYTLQIVIQAALDIASHIVSDEQLGEPNTNRELFDLIAKNGWLSPGISDTMRSIVGFRNILVHGYQTVDLKIMRDVLEHHLEDLIAFVAAIRNRLP